MIGVSGWVRTVGRRLARAVAVVALVGAAAIAGATAAQAEPPPFGSPYTPQDGYCTTTVSDADCWHYAHTFQSPEDCRVYGLGITYGYAGQVACTSSGRSGNTALWIWRSEGDCPVAGSRAQECRGGLHAGEGAWWDMPTPID